MIAHAQAILAIVRMIRDRYRVSIRGIVIDQLQCQPVPSRAVNVCVFPLGRQASASYTTGAVLVLAPTPRAALAKHIYACALKIKYLYAYARIYMLQLRVLMN